MLGCIARLLSSLLVLILFSLRYVSAERRSLHWVIRATSVSDTITFFKEIFLLQVLRHEENDQTCPITCNGRLASPWSKTMMGYRTEDLGYALEITHNYVGDVPPHPESAWTRPGKGLLEIGFRADDVAKSLAAAERLGYATLALEDRHVIFGPDGYMYGLFADAFGAGAEFAHVALAVENFDTSSRFYQDKLGMHEVKTSGATLQPISNGRRVRKQIVLTYPSHSEGGVETSALLVLVELAPLSGSDEGPAPVDPEALTHWSGRHALILPDEEVRLVNAYAEQQGLVVHPLQELEEKLGKISLAIIKDPDGFEIAVATDSITQAMLAATTFPDPASFLSSYEERKTKYEMSWLKSEL
eukprot:TRINITY_DN3540_c0_g1_i2.p1 TRINITY_DN3540_c0_g1~~TRINITY_DN3540_c0_g1_i2.p1  ORF type:complete len:358 (-),score=82.95 TRINITY_DN3540_c0_g1_i2:52-1125(-)